MLAARTIVSVLAVAGLAAVGFVGVRELRERRPRAVSEERPSPGPVPITTRRLEARDVPRRIEAFGTLAAARRALLAPEVAGRVSERLPDWRPGLWVAAGTELVRIEDTALRLALDETEALVREADAALAAARLAVENAQLELEPVRERWVIAKRELERGGELLDEGISSASRLDGLRSAERAADIAVRQVTSRLEAARAEVDVRNAAKGRAESARATATDRVARSSVEAPFDGWLVGRPPDVGSYVGPNVVIAELVDLQELQLVTRVAEIELEGLAEGCPAIVTTPALPLAATKGVVRSVGVDADPAARSVAVEIAVANVPGSDGEAAAAVGDGPAPRPALVAGQFARAEIDVGVLQDVVTIERKELTWRDGRPLAYVLEHADQGPVARERSLELGRAVAEGFVVASGLRPGETLIVAPLDRMADGALCLAGEPNGKEREPAGKEREPAGKEREPAAKEREPAAKER